MTARCVLSRWNRYNQESLPQEQRETSTQFKYILLWHLIYNREPAILTWDRAIHKGNVPLHVEALSSVQLVFRLLEHYHCALALAAYLRDMSHLKTTHPSLYLQSSDREIKSLTKMDGSWSDMACVRIWFRWRELFRKLSTHLWTKVDTVVVAGFNIVNPFRRWRIWHNKDVTFFP